MADEIDQPADTSANVSKPAEPALAPKAPTPAPAPEVTGFIDVMIHANPAVGIFDDAYAGQGGCYVIDPATGKRVPA